MAEQLRLDQFLGNRGAVHLDEPFAAAQAVPMNGSGDEFLADTALAGDEHGGVGRRRPADRRHHLLEPAAVADHLMADLDGALERPVLVPEAGLLEGVLNRHAQPVGALERLLEKVERALPDRLDRRARRPVRGDHHDRQRVVHGMQTRQDVEAVHARHLHVEQHQVGRFPFDQREPFLAGRGSGDVVAVVLERHPQRFADPCVIVDDEYAWLGHSQRPSTRTVNRRR